MLVGEVMTRNVVAIGPDMPVRDVAALMGLRRVRHFPIVEEEGDEARLVGIVSDRDLREVGSPLPGARPGVTVQDQVRGIMSAPVITAHPDDAVEDAARRLRRHRVGALPVLDGARLVGIVTAADLIEAMVRTRSGSQASSRLEVEVPNRPGALASLLSAVARLGLNVSAVDTTRSEPDAVVFVVRIDTIDPRGVAGSRRGDGFTVLWPALADAVPVAT
jgi:acetoin utilization protein AcuB